MPRAIVRDLHAGERAATMLSLMGIVLGIAPIVAPIIGSHLHVWFGWQANFVFVAAYGATRAGFAWCRCCRKRSGAQCARDEPARHARELSRGCCARDATSATCWSQHSRRAGSFAFLAGSAFVFVSVIGTGEEGFGLLFGAVMLGNIIGCDRSGAVSSTRLGIDRMIRYSTWLMLFAGVALAALAWARVASSAGDRRADVPVHGRAS